MFIALIWKFDFAPFMVLIMAILNDGTIMTISKDRVKPSPQTDSWKLMEIFATVEIVTVMNTNFLLLRDKFGVRSLRHSPAEMMAALYLQVATALAVYANWSFARIKGMG
ncbi:hypothetical protein HN51_050770 [Arachis hypogaea]